MNVLVVGGLHGNEPFGIALVRSLQSNPISNVTAILGNPRAIETKCRYIDEDLNRVFPGSESGSYETQRASEIVELAQPFDLVLDFHNTPCPNNDCSFVGRSGLGLKSLASWLELPRLIIADYPCINTALPHALSIELSLNSALCSVTHWRTVLQNLAQSSTIPQGKQHPTLYAFAGRVLRSEHDTSRFAHWEPFVPLALSDLIQLGRNPSEILCPIFIGQSFVVEQYAALVQPVKITWSEPSM